MCKPLTPKKPELRLNGRHVTIQNGSELAVGLQLIHAFFEHQPFLFLCRISRFFEVLTLVNTSTSYGTLVLNLRKT